MNPLLTALGIPNAVQEFFDIDELVFSYGEHFEHYDMGFHRVPTTKNLWIAGSAVTREVIITSTAMEAIAYLAVNLNSYPNLQSLSFIAIGNLPHPGQLNWIKTHFPKRKFTLVFGKDLLGRLADIRVAAGLFYKPVRLLRSEVQIQILCGEQVYGFDQDTISLNSFEKATGIRTGVRTAKSKQFDTYLDQLKHYAKP